MNVLSPQQQQVVSNLIPIAKIATDGSRVGLVINPRVQTLIIGPSGSGKSFVAAEIANQLSSPCLKINVGSWILMASRSSPSTWSVIVDWLTSLRSRSGGTIILDEIDKLTSSQEYTSSLKLEIHDLLDGRIPPSLSMPTQADESYEIPAPLLGQIDRGAAEKVLQGHVMIIACGAFQGVWRANANQMGFGGMETRERQSSPTNKQILSSIDPELRQRFREEIAILPPMTSKDYHQVAKAISAAIPPELKKEWDAHSASFIARAVEGTLGMRIFEELILKAMIETKKIRNEIPIPEPPGETGIHQSIGYAPAGC